MLPPVHACGAAAGIPLAASPSAPHGIRPAPRKTRESHRQSRFNACSVLRRPCREQASQTPAADSKWLAKDRMSTLVLTTHPSPQQTLSRRYAGHRMVMMSESPRRPPAVKLPRFAATAKVNTPARIITSALLLRNDGVVSRRARRQNVLMLSPLCRVGRRL